ncbi:MAG: hypothetical protein PHT50_06995 [Candidatus Omnitrophica bacterium]|nr:hypothetical protein [Candidatus Omnitrophota bacterium]
MKRACKLSSLILTLMLLSGSAHIACAEESNNEGLISRPVIEYSSGDLRDPFGDLLQLAIEKEQQEKEEKSKQQPREEANPQKSMINLDQFKVQGVVWGGRLPLVIINNKILGVGDSIDGAKIVNIDKKGVTLNLAGEKINLPAPGNVLASKEEDKEEK